MIGSPRFSPWIERGTLVLILLLALLLRLGMGIYLGFDSGPDPGACGADTVEFEQMGWTAARGLGFKLTDSGPSTAFRAPGYPMLLAVLYRIGGRRFWLNRVALSLISVGTCWLVYRLGLKLSLPSITALAAAFLTAVLPLQFYWCGHFMSEPLAAFLNVATSLALTAALFRPSQSRPQEERPVTDWVPSLWGCLGAGILCGLAGLVRAGALLVPVGFALLALLCLRIRFRSALMPIVAFTLGTAISLTPWVMRNRLVLGRWVLVSTNGGSTFWGANNALVAKPGPHWGSWISTSHVDRGRKEREVWSLENEADQDKKEWQIGMEFLKRNPRSIPLLMLGKLYRLLTPFPQSANKTYVVAVALGQIFLLPTTILGMILLLRKPQHRERFIALNAQLLALLGTTLVFYGSERFRMPYEPFLAVYAAAGIVAFLERLVARRSASCS